MATPPDFSSGAVLTAAQMNAVGLWLVKTQTIGSAVSSVSVTDAFSADYDNYKIIVSGGTASASSNLNLRLGASATAYYGGLIFMAYTAGVTSAGLNNGSSIPWVGSGEAAGLQVNLDLLNPFLAKVTTFNGSYAGNATGSIAGNLNGFHNSAVSYSAFTLFPASGTLTGGTIRVYGYRN